MMKRVLALAALICAASAAHASDLIVTVSGVSPASGIVRVILMDDPDGAAHQEESRNLDASQAKDGMLTTRFKGLAPNTFGVLAVEEKTVNHALEKAFTGKVAAPMASSPETHVTLVEPSTAVTIQLPAAQ